MPGPPRRRPAATTTRRAPPRPANPRPAPRAAAAETAPRSSTGKPAEGAHAAAEAALRAHALAKPGATEHFPWGDRAIKVAGKVFLFMSSGPAPLSLSTKLPSSSGVALLLPFAEPTGYGLGKAGWVSARFEPTAIPPVEMLCAWIDESYQAVAPAKLAAAARALAPGEPAAPRAQPPGEPAATTARRKPRRR